MLSRRGLSVFLELDGALVVLFKITGRDGVTLGFHKILHPDSIWEIVAETHEFRVSGAFGDILVFIGGTENATATKCLDAAGLTLTVGVDPVRDVNERIHRGEGVGTNSHRQIEGAADIFEKAL